MRRLISILVLCCASLSAQTITGVAVNATGYDIGVSISGFTDLGAVATGINGTTNNPTWGCVTTSGTAVTQVTCPNGTGGSTFTTGGAWTGSPIAINNVLYTISSVGSTTSLTLASSAGTQSTPVIYTQATIMLAVTRPTDYGGSTGTVTDIVYGTANMRYPYPLLWAATTVHAVGDRVADATIHCNSTNNGCVQKVIACSGTCTTGGSAPAWTNSGGTCGSTIPLGCSTVDNSGANQVTWRNEGSLPQQGAPGVVQAFDDNISVGGTVTVRVSLSDFVYSVDTATVIIAPSFYHDNGPGGTSSFSSALASTAVTNNSTVTYATSKPICRATWPGFERVTNDFPVEVLCANRFGRNKSEVQSVVFTATDAHSNSVSFTASSMTQSVYNQTWTNASVPYASGPGDQHPVYVYSGVIPVSTLTQGDKITVTWLVYPWAGDSTAIFNSAVGSDGVAQPSENAGPLYYILDKTGAYGLAFATVKTTGSDSTCTGRVFTTRASAEADTGLLTMAKAASCIEAYNNTNYSRANTCGGMILMGASQTWTTGTSTFALGTSPCWLVVDKISTLTPSQVVFTTQGNNGFPDSDSNTLLKFQNLTIGGTGGLFFGSATGTDSIWFHNVQYYNTNQTNVENNGGVIYVTQSTTLPATGYFYYNGGNKRIAYVLVRGVAYNSTLTSDRYASVYTVIGDYGVEPYEVYGANSASQGSSDNGIVAYSSAYSATDGNSGSGNLTATGQSLTKGVAWLQTILEGGIFNFGDVSAQTTAMTVNNFVLHHLIDGLGGQSTFQNIRNHMCYETISNFSNTMNNWSNEWNDWGQFSSEHDASFLSGAGNYNPARVGAWPCGQYGAGTLGNLEQTIGTLLSPNFMGLGFELAAQSPNFVNGTNYFGNYRIPSNSVNIGLAPWTTNFNEVLPYDLLGAPRTCPIGVGCTAGAYMYTVGGSIMKSSTARKSTSR